MSSLLLQAKRIGSISEKRFHSWERSTDGETPTGACRVTPRSPGHPARQGTVQVGEAGLTRRQTWVVWGSGPGTVRAPEWQVLLTDSTTPKPPGTQHSPGLANGSKVCPRDLAIHQERQGHRHAVTCGDDKGPAHRGSLGSRGSHQGSARQHTSPTTRGFPEGKALRLRPGLSGRPTDRQACSRQRGKKLVMGAHQLVGVDSGRGSTQDDVREVGHHRECRQDPQPLMAGQQRHIFED